MDYMNDDCAALVRYGYTPVVDTQAAYGADGFMRPQLWAEPDVLHAAALMRRLVDDSAYRNGIATQGRAVANARREAFFGGGAAAQLRAFYEAFSA